MKIPISMLLMLEKCHATHGHDSKSFHNHSVVQRPAEADILVEICDEFWLCRDPSFSPGRE